MATTPTVPVPAVLPQLLIGLYDADGRLVRTVKVEDPRERWCSCWNLSYDDDGLIAKPVTEGGADL